MPHPGGPRTAAGDRAEAVGLQHLPLAELLDDAGEYRPLHVGQDEFLHVSIGVAISSSGAAPVGVLREGSRSQPVRTGVARGRSTVFEDTLQLVCQADVLLLPLVVNDLQGRLLEGDAVAVCEGEEQAFQEVRVGHWCRSFLRWGHSTCPIYDSSIVRRAGHIFQTKTP